MTTPKNFAQKNKASHFHTPQSTESMSETISINAMVAIAACIKYIKTFIR